MACLALLRSARPIGRRGAVLLAVTLAASVSLTATAAAHVRSSLHTVGGATLQNGRLVLTESAPGRVGAAWQVPAVKLPSTFKATFDFALSDPVGNADGYAFVIQGASADALGGGGGGLGYDGIPNSIAVEFDTYPNAFDPAVPHISIHTRGAQPNSVDEQYSIGVSTDVPFLSNGARHSVTIRYRHHTLSVTLDGQLKLSVPIDLKERLDLSHGRAWFGFTGATGALWQRQEILSYRLVRSGECRESKGDERARSSTLIRSDHDHGHEQCVDSPKLSEPRPSDDDDDD
jgi:lectin family protein